MQTKKNYVKAPLLDTSETGSAINTVLNERKNITLDERIPFSKKNVKKKSMSNSSTPSQIAPIGNYAVYGKPGLSTLWYL